jgi:hypothetical protein
MPTHKDQNDLVTLSPDGLNRARIAPFARNKQSPAKRGICLQRRQSSRLLDVETTSAFSYPKTFSGCLLDFATASRDLSLPSGTVVREMLACIVSDEG